MYFIDDCEDQVMLLINKIENNTGISHRIPNTTSIASSMTGESVEFDQ